MTTKAPIIVDCPEPRGLVKKSTVPDGIVNYGNPVFTLDPTIKTELPKPEISEEDWAAGYRCEAQNILYKTTSSSYGSLPPTVHTVPAVFYSRTQKFSDHLGKCGMPRNRGFNCTLDKTRLPE